MDYMNKRLTFWLALILALWLPIYGANAIGLASCDRAMGNATAFKHCCDGANHEGMHCQMQQRCCPCSASCNNSCASNLASAVTADISMPTPPVGSEYSPHDEKQLASFTPDVPRPPPRIL